MYEMQEGHIVEKTGLNRTGLDRTGFVKHGFVKKVIVRHGLVKSGYFRLFTRGFYFLLSFISRLAS